jgi:YHS domain-containing protein
MIRFFVLKILVPLLLFLLLRAVLRSLFASRGVSRSNSEPERRAPAQAGELKKDPVCGTYVSTATGLTRMVDGKPVYFCSEQCRDKYRVA